MTDTDPNAPVGSSYVEPSSEEVAKATALEAEIAALKAQLEAAHHENSVLDNQLRNVSRIGSADPASTQTQNPTKE